MDLESLINLEKRHLWHPFTPMQAWCADGHEPMLMVQGSGCKLRDQHGREYLDGNSSIWTNIHGHRHPIIDAAIVAQLERVAHTSFLGLTHEPAIQLAEQLCALFPSGELSRVFYSDNGSTAIESAVRMALQFWQQNQHPEKQVLLAFDQAYHGDTLGAASLGGIPLFKGSGNDFGYEVITVRDITEVKALPPDVTQRIAAAIIEPLIQGAAGMRMWPAGMLRELRTWCTENDVFLILDEVMTGFGRTGKMFACQHEDVVPDFIAMAKGLTGGYLPMAATMTTERVFEGFLGTGKTFFYGHSYTGSQLGCAAALGSLQVFRDEAVLASLPAKMAVMAEVLETLSHLPNVINARQCGMIGALDVVAQKDPVTPFPSDLLTGAKICHAARSYGLLTRPVRDTLVLMPPLCVTDAELREMGRALEAAIECGVQL